MNLKTLLWIGAAWAAADLLTGGQTDLGLFSTLQRLRDPGPVWRMWRWRRSDMQLRTSQYKTKAEAYQAAGAAVAAGHRVQLKSPDGRLVLDEGPA